MRSIREPSGDYLHQTVNVKRREQHLHPYCCLENSHEQRSLVSYSSRGHKELDMTSD